jgi:hypothetical protein
VVAEKGDLLLVSNFQTSESGLIPKAEVAPLLKPPHLNCLYTPHNVEIDIHKN